MELGVIVEAEPLSFDFQLVLLLVHTQMLIKILPHFLPVCPSQRDAIHAILYYTNTILYYAILYHTILYKTRLESTRHLNIYLSTANVRVWVLADVHADFIRNLVIPSCKNLCLIIIVLRVVVGVVVLITHTVSENFASDVELISTVDRRWCCAMLGGVVSTMPCNAMQCQTPRYNTMQYHTMPCNNIQCHAIPYNAMQYHTIPYHTMCTKSPDIITTKRTRLIW